MLSIEFQEVEDKTKENILCSPWLHKPSPDSVMIKPVEEDMFDIPEVPMEDD